MSEKKRLDVILTERGLAESREKAKALIMSGEVFVDGEKCDKAGTMVNPDKEISVKEKLKYVSRGGLKLEKAIDKHNISLEGVICMDIGASTGGFTDCMLQNGAQKVYAIDVGYGQLAWKLRTDPRVINIERTNIRYLTKEQVPELCGFATIDVSFISLKLVLPVLKNFLTHGGRAVMLVKPQFEAGKEKVGKKGVVRDPGVHTEVLENTLDLCAQIGFSVLDMDFSPIKGPEGNIEYLFYIENSDKPAAVDKVDAASLVKASHESLDY